MKKNQSYLDQADLTSHQRKVLRNYKKHHPLNLVFKELNQAN